MRVVVLVKATADSERGDLPRAELLEAMGSFNQQLIEAGVLLAADGLKPSSVGKRVAFEGSLLAATAQNLRRLAKLAPPRPRQPWREAAPSYSSAAHLSPGPHPLPPAKRLIQQHRPKPVVDARRTRSSVAV